jgi:AcrR family transcriptional regulator
MAGMGRLSKEQIVATAVELAGADGWDGLGWSDLAQALGIKPPSLYNHFADLEAVRAAAAAAGLDELLRELTLATAGHAGEDAVYALGNAYRRFSRKRAPLYAAITRFGDRQSAASQQLLALMEQILAPFGLDRIELLHATRGLRALAHGFSAVEGAGGFRSTGASRDESFRWLMGCFLDGIKART